MVVNRKTRISAVIKANKQSIDAITSINKHFNKLRNPVLRKVLAPRVTVEDAAKIVSSTKQSISEACLSVNKKHKGFYYSYHFQEPFVPGIDKRLKTVYQYNLDGTFVQKFKSVAEASKNTGVSKTSISRVCRREREKSGEFIWRYGK